MTIRRLAVLLFCAVIAVAARARAQQPPADLPGPAEWKRHFETDILPFWQTAAALGVPVGDFPTVRCDDGSLYDAAAPCPEYVAAPEWIRAGIGRHYARMISRQIYLYGVAFHLTGEAKYLRWAQAGVRHLLDDGFDPGTGNVASYWEAGKPVFDPPDKTSQDLAYALVGLSFYYYLTRDDAVLPAILRIEGHIRKTYFNPRPGLYRLKATGPDAGRPVLVAQLDQANAYMLLLTPLLPEPHRQRWRNELADIARVMRARFFHPASRMFLGVLDPKAASGDCIYKREDTDFGHTIKTHWMLYLIGRVTGDGALSGFARDNAAEILHRAFLPDTGSWATQPTCDPAPHELDRTSTWWMAAELDQAALTLGLAAPRLLSYLPRTYRFWTWHMVDHAHGEVWDEVALPGFAPRLPKVHLWKNGFHTAEHALVGYIAASAARSAPVTLHFAFRGCKLPTVLRPYYFDGTLSSHAEAPMPDMPGFCRSQATFTAVH